MFDSGKFVASFLDEYQKVDSKFETGQLVPHFGLNLQFLTIANVFYFSTLLGLYLVMRNRQPLKLLNFMRLYNFTCVILAGLVVVGITEHCLRHGMAKFVGNGDLLDGRTESGQRLSFVLWLYYAQKFWEFLDSFVFILRHKWNQLSFLHIYHHSSITIVTFAFLVYGGSGDVLLGAFFNSFIHVLMYSHYLVSTFKRKTADGKEVPIELWWKPYLTRLQLIQFVTVAAQALMSLTLPETVGWPYFLRWTMFFYTMSMIVLFGDFYIKSYMNKSSRAKSPSKQE